MDPDPEGPKTCGSGGSGSATLVLVFGSGVQQNNSATKETLITHANIRYRTKLGSTVRNTAKIVKLLKGKRIPRGMHLVLFESD